MVVGVGTDLVDLDRFRQAAERTPGILTRYFTADEQAYAERRAGPHRALRRPLRGQGGGDEGAGGRPRRL